MTNPVLSATLKLPQKQAEALKDDKAPAVVTEDMQASMLAAQGEQNQKPGTDEEVQNDPALDAPRLPEVPHLKKAEAPFGIFQAVRLPHYITADGTKYLPKDGFFVPKTQEASDMLDYYEAQQMDYVKRVK